MSINTEDVSEPSSPDTPFDDTDLLNPAVNDDVTAQLAAAGPIGVAAAAAIATGKKRKRPHSFETNPSIRKRIQKRLLRKLKNVIDEYTTRVGQQAVVLCCTPGKTDNNFKVFGAAPLENVIRQAKGMLMNELQEALNHQAPKLDRDNSNQFELPPLVIEGIPTPVDKMTQAQLRAFIPLMLKYSTGRGKPGWGKESCRPVWWPSDLPWANVRSDVRSEEDKNKVSWTHALRTIVKNCYKHHAREDLLPEFNEDKEKDQQLQHANLLPTHTVVQTVPNEDGTFSLIQVDTGSTVATLTDVSQLQAMQGIQLQPIQIQQQSASQGVQTLAEVAATQQGVVAQVSQSVPVTVQLTGHQRVATLATATLPAGTQIMLSNGTVGTISAMSEGIVIPTQVYQTVTQVETSEGTVMQPIQMQGGQVVTTTQAGAQIATIANGTAAQTLKIEHDVAQNSHATEHHSEDNTQVIAMPMVAQQPATSQATVEVSQATVEVVPMDH